MQRERELYIPRIREYATTQLGIAQATFFVTCQNEFGPFIFKELLNGRSRMSRIALRPKTQYPYALQWDGKYLTFETEGGGAIYQVEVKGNVGKVIGSAELTGGAGDYIYWIEGGAALAWYDQIGKGNNLMVAAWDYPTGGEPTEKYSIDVGRGGVEGIAVSVAPSRTRIARRDSK